MDGIELMLVVIDRGALRNAGLPGLLAIRARLGKMI